MAKYGRHAQPRLQPKQFDRKYTNEPASTPYTQVLFQQTCRTPAQWSLHRKSSLSGKGSPNPQALLAVETLPFEYRQTLARKSYIAFEFLTFPS